MPFRRADIGHRLDRLIFRREPRGELLALQPNCLKPAARGRPAGVASLLLGANFDHRYPLAIFSVRAVRVRPASPARDMAADNIRVNLCVADWFSILNRMAGCGDDTGRRWRLAPPRARTR